ncbi:aspartyl/asparaginyl beta-hydroxylase (cupin superfamily)/thioredoxin-like negative regulator of GroEL [Novosphingobium chloroacetimidivorans]|uniref:Aspartyl/asparaginyl beta-hydroxylase (Cupin superfamily)/thioredoxin-like negative regulator of GroEL n=1 Tax=Novosphingobium chloroacetimidivorans TaxID=1428314 RepID=A0A7W7NYI3_9SPHN|nr:aspartyl/asparaginyl beta-hydroxylase domain-containing protein [Novosphingobium chloroacetimidivorans]MBB4860255.1 aspartyl/asparaginyl beta-hydroxylase (cupin superfamily)/thioredoxin-like negative regulator of GroEL [Novosphingobium chloroacetimidivorans]
MNQIEVEQALRAAAGARQAGQIDRAARLYGDVLTKAGEHPVALNALGVMALAAGSFAQAAILFRRALAVDAAAIDLWLNLATAHRHQDDAPGERSALAGALRLDQRHFMANVRLAELCERSGDASGAAERWRGVLAMAPLIEEPTPAMAAMFAHARSFVEQQQAGFAAAVDADLAPVRASHSVGARRRFDASIDHLLGRRQIYPNVCAGLHMPFLPADEFFERRHFPWLDQLEQATEAITAEYLALRGRHEGEFKPYVAMAPGTPANKWSPLDNKLDWGAYHLWRNGERDDEACARCPRTTELVEALPLARIPGRAPTVFFSVLEPGAHLPAHTGVSNVRAIIHLPLIVPDGCTFRVGGDTRTWRKGQAWAFDDTIEHEAWNRSTEQRAILIFDVWNPHLTTAEQELLAEFYPIADRHGYAAPDDAGS